MYNTYENVTYLRELLARTHNLRSWWGLPLPTCRRCCLQGGRTPICSSTDRIRNTHIYTNQTHQKPVQIHYGYVSLLTAQVAPSVQFRLYFFICCPDCPSCLAHLNHIGRAIYIVWAAIKKYNIKQGRQWRHLRQLIKKYSLWKYVESSIADFHYNILSRTLTVHLQ